MKFDDAILDALFNGSKITRKGLNKFYTAAFMIYTNGTLPEDRFDIHDVLAEDWEIITEIDQQQICQ